MIDPSDHGITIDQDGVVWTATNGSAQLIRFDPATGSVRSYSAQGGERGFRGVGAHPNGTIWVASNSPDRLIRFTFADDGVTLQETRSVAVGNTSSAAVIDVDGFVWTTTYGDNLAWKVDPDTVTVVPGWPILTGQVPYNYSDMTGQAVVSVNRAGTWTEIIDSDRLGTPWAGFVLNASAPSDTSVKLFARAGDDRGALGSLPFAEVAPGVALDSLRGQFLELQISFRAQNTSANPSVQDLTVVTVLPPTITALPLSPNGRAAVGQTLVLSGQAVAAQPVLGQGEQVSNRIVAVSINGVPSDVIDSVGRFFTRINVQPGLSEYHITATDAYGQTAATTLTLDGTESSAASIDFSQTVDLSASFGPDYARTSFNDDSRVLHADVAIANTGIYPADVPLLVGVTNISDVVASQTLEPGGVTGTVDLAFFNPDRLQFSYNLVFFGRLNREPAFTSLPDTEALAGRTYTYDADGTDPDGDPLSFSLLSGPDDMAVNPTTGEITWTPTAADTGTHTIALRVEDDRGGSAEQHYVVSVIAPPPNRPPFFTSVPVVSANVNTPFTYKATATDPDDDPLTFSVVVGPSGMTVHPGTGLVTWTPSDNELGAQSVTLEVEDGRGGTAQQTFVIVSGDADVNASA